MTPSPKGRQSLRRDGVLPPLKGEAPQCAHRDGEVLAFLVTGLHMTIEKTKKSAARNVRRLIPSLILSMMGHCVSLV